MIIIYNIIIIIIMLKQCQSFSQSFSQSFIYNNNNVNVVINNNIRNKCYTFNKYKRNNLSLLKYYSSAISSNISYKSYSTLINNKSNSKNTRLINTANEYKINKSFKYLSSNKERLKSTLSYSSQKEPTNDTLKAIVTNKKIPITLLAGFLGSGKTSTLKYILETKDHGLKVGVIVNDIAEVNIDSKYIKSTQSNNPNIDNASLNSTVELQNGCACCSLSDELLT